MASEQAEETQGRLRRLNMDIVSAAIAAVGALLIATDAASLPEGIALGAGLAAAMMVVNRWAAGRGPHPALLIAVLVFVTAVWVAGVLAADAGTAVYSVAVVATVAVSRLPRHRRAAAAGCIASGAALVAVKAALTPEDPLETVLRYGVATAAVAATGFVLVSLVFAVRDNLAELERAREREAEMAVMRERVRFAGDLHDIQGHTLHVVKLKVALARKLLRADTDRAERELDEVYDQVGDTIARTRDLAYAQRRLNLSAELENAKNLFEAAGIRVEVERRGEVDERSAELVGQVLRETTTNILRHAQARRVRITLAETGIIITNDGAGRGPAPALRGLAALGERVAGAGGTLTARREDGRFLTAVSFPAAGTDR
ncbi:sensor histidine kinase [Nocardiopsis sp. CC223A]|uniref:sensor histidine kinase n=1 Tax=Nocardiopsis sp. CC223A TaxID=3044051 RepID=UPI00278C3959|nr:histidine kinase [Nocardiopsis sp. CC223A]